MKPFFFLLMWLVVQTANAQQPITNYDRLGLLIGGQQTHLLDQQFSPLTYSANEFSVKLFYDGKHQLSNWNASFDVTTGSLFPRQYADRMVYNTTEDIEGNVTTDSFFVRGHTRTVNLQFGYAHDLIQSGHWTLNLGANVRNQLMYPTTFVNLGIMNAASLVVASKATWYMNTENQFTLGIGVPVLGFNTRFPYSGTVSRPNQTLVEAFFDGGTNFVSFGAYTQVSVNCGYRFALSPKTGIGLQYDFMWQRYTIPATLKQYAGRIGATIDINF